MRAKLIVGFGGSSQRECLALSDAGWTPADAGEQSHIGAWDYDESAHWNRKHVAIAPVAALLFPVERRLEEAGPSAFLRLAASAGVELDESLPQAEAARAWTVVWELMKTVDRELLAWAADIIRDGEISRLALISLFVETELEPFSAMYQGDYVTLPPPEIRDETARGAAEIAPDDVVRTAFQQGDRLERALAGFEWREEQAEMARHVWNAFKSESHLIVEAGTGIGKSLAYLLPAVLHAETKRSPIAISTNTINLQEQLLGNDIEIVRAALPEVRFSVGLLKGRSHYFCRLRAREAMFRRGEQCAKLAEACADVSDDGWEFVLRIGFFHAATSDGDLDAVPSPPGLRTDTREQILRLIDCGSASCIRRKCQYRDHCWFYAARDGAVKNHIVVMNHALLFRLLSAETEDVETFLSKCNSVVFDEAHNLEDVITGQMTYELSGQAILDLANRILKFIDNPFVHAALSAIAERDSRDAYHLRSEIAKEISLWIDVKRRMDNWAAGVLGASQSLDMSLTTPEPAEAPHAQKILALVSDAQKTFAPIAKRIDAVIELAISEDSDFFVSDEGFQSDAQLVMSETADTAMILAKLVEEGTETVRWVKLSQSREGINVRLYVCPIDIGPIFRAFLEAKGSVVMTSATLTVAKSFAYLRSRLGLMDMPDTALSEVALETPFRIEEQAKLCIPSDIPEPDFSKNAPYLERISGLVTQIGEEFHGGTLALFNSYADMQAVYKSVKRDGDSSLTILCQGVDGSRTELAERMRKESGILLLGTRSFWEGLDVPGEALRCVILTRLPFANFKEPVQKARAAAIRESGRSDFLEYSLPQAAMRLKQGFGRLIRTRTDRGCIFVLDSRILRKNYGAYFISSLPDHVSIIGPAERVIGEAVEWYFGKSEAGGAAG